MTCADNTEGGIKSEMQQRIAYHLANAISLSVLMSSSASLASSADCLQYTAQISRKEASDAESAPGKRENRERERERERERGFMSPVCTVHLHKHLWRPGYNM